MIVTDKVKGFTLVELLIVLVIMSLLLSLVPPLLSSVMPSVTIKATANDLYHDIKYVRNMAILNGRQTSIILNTLNNSYFSEYKDNGSEVSLPSDIKMSVNGAYQQATNGDTNTISFFADGSSSGAIVLLSTNEKAYTILVDWLTGKVSIFEGKHNEKV